VTTLQFTSLVVLFFILGAAYLPTLAPLVQDPKARQHLIGLLKHVVVLVAVTFTALQFLKKDSSPRPAAPPVATALESASSSDRAKVRAIYSALADVTQRDGGRLITSTAVWRAIHSDALRLAAGGTDLVGKYTGLDTAVEKVLAEHFTLDNTPLDAAQVEKIVAGCRAVEKQCE
jgi:hypothetical protein